MPCGVQQFLNASMAVGTAISAAEQSDPLVSILIPVYNREKILADTIQSALDQTYRQIEIIIVDNASTDGTWDVCQEFANRDPRVRIFRNDSNLGPVRNWLRCIEEARGVYGKILFSDDLISDDFTEKALPWIRNDDIAFVWSIIEIGERRGEGSHYWWRGKTGTYSSTTFIRESMIGGKTPGSPGAALFRMSDLRKNLLLDIPSIAGTDFSRFGAGPDMLLFLLTAEAYPKVAYISEPLVFFLRHSDSITVQEVQSMWAHYFQARVWFASRLSEERYTLFGSLMQMCLAFGWQTICQKQGVQPVETFTKQYLDTAPKVGWLVNTEVIIRRLLMKVVRTFSKSGYEKSVRKYKY